MIPNFALWFICLGAIPLIFIEGGSNDGFGDLSVGLIMAGVTMAIMSAGYNIYKEQKK
jgi:hypothetical protein